MYTMYTCIVETRLRLIKISSRPEQSSQPASIVQDEIIVESGTGTSSGVQTKQQTGPCHSSVPVLRCTVPGCPSFKSQFVFNTQQNYEKHIK